MPKQRALNAARTSLAGLVEVWGTVRLGLALASAAICDKPLSELDAARMLDVPAKKAKTKLQELIELGRVEEVKGGYAACPEWAHWTGDQLIASARAICEAVDGAGGANA